MCNRAATKGGARALEKISMRPGNSRRIPLTLGTSRLGLMVIGGYQK
jgi:hypothetical protein